LRSKTASIADAKGYRLVSYDKGLVLCEIIPYTNCPTSIHPNRKIYHGQMTGKRGSGKMQNTDGSREFSLVWFAAVHRQTQQWQSNRM
jgi:hypothetical protein